MLNALNIDMLKIKSHATVLSFSNVYYNITIYYKNFFLTQFLESTILLPTMETERKQANVQKLMPEIIAFLEKYGLSSDLANQEVLHVVPDLEAIRQTIEDTTSLFFSDNS